MRLLAIGCSILALAAPAAQAAPNAPAQTPPTAAITPDDTARRLEARAIIEVMFPPATREATLQRTIEDLNTSMLQTMQMPAVTDPGLKAIFDRFLLKMRAESVTVAQQNFPRTLAAMEGAYSRAFTLAELKDIHAFARTPSGQKYLQRSSTMTTDPEVRAANLAAMAEGRARSRAILDAFKAEVLTYVRAHPNAIRPNVSER